MQSEIGISPEAFWAMPVMPQVNRELGPVARMTFPAALRETTLADCATGKDLFASIILLFGIFPVDVHRLRLDSKDARGFDERSASWMNRLWHHERRIEATPTGAVVTDTVEVRGRAPFLTLLIMPVYRAIFRHRHAQLRRQFPVAA